MAEAIPAPFAVTTSPVPPAVDSDRDGFADPGDACPALPGMFSPAPDRNGCPPPGYYDAVLGPPDADGDAVADNDDRCPEVGGPPSADPATTGCPPAATPASTPTADACAALGAAEARAAGCPPAYVLGDRIAFVDAVSFESGSATLIAASHAVLGAVADVLARHAEIRRVRVEGHTDARGGARMNRKLSQERAEAVARWLETRGVARERLEPIGLGFDQPIATNDTEEGRARNRRVEFRIVDRDERVAPTPAAPTLAALAPAAAGATSPPPPVLWGGRLDGFDPPIAPAPPASAPAQGPPVEHHPVLGRDIGY